MWIDVCIFCLIMVVVMFAVAYNNERNDDDADRK